MKPEDGWPVKYVLILSAFSYVTESEGSLTDGLTVVPKGQVFFLGYSKAGDKNKCHYSFSKPLCCCITGVCVFPTETMFDRQFCACG